MKNIVIIFLLFISCGESNSNLITIQDFKINDKLNDDLKKIERITTFFSDLEENMTNYEKNAVKSISLLIENQLNMADAKGQTQVESTFEAISTLGNMASVTSSAVMMILKGTVYGELTKLESFSSTYNETTLNEMSGALQLLAKSHESLLIIDNLNVLENIFPKSALTIIKTNENIKDWALDVSKEFMSYLDAYIQFYASLSMNELTIDQRQILIDEIKNNEFNVFAKKNSLKVFVAKRNDLYTKINEINEGEFKSILNLVNEDTAKSLQTFTTEFSKKELLILETLNLNSNIKMEKIYNEFMVTGESEKQKKAVLKQLSKF